MVRAWVTVAVGAVIGLAAPLPAGAAPSAGLTLDLPAAAAATELGGGDNVVKLDNSTGHDLSRVVLRVRLTGALARRVELASADGCDLTKTTATCKVDRITPGGGISVRLDLRARKGAPLGAAGSAVVTAQAVGTAAVSGTFGVGVASPPYADVSADAAQTELYAHVGDTVTGAVVYRNTGPVPARLRVADPAAKGFDEVAWLDCAEDEGDACVVELPAGQSRRLAFAMRLAGPHPAEPHVAMTVEGAYDRIVTDNLATFTVCVFDTGRCTRHLPGQHTDVFAAPSARAVPAPADHGPATEDQAVALLEPAPVPVAMHREEAAEKRAFDFVDEITAILAYSMLALLIIGGSVALALRKRAADRA